MCIGKLTQCVPSICCQVDGVRRATPLLLVLVCIELSDIVFAVDSIPAVFAVTKVTATFVCPLSYIAIDATTLEGTFRHMIYVTDDAFSPESCRNDVHTGKHRLLGHMSMPDGRIWAAGLS